MLDQVFQAFSFGRISGSGDAKDKSPGPMTILFVSPFDHLHIGFGAIAGISLHNYHVSPSGGHKLRHHLPKEDILLLIVRMCFGQNETKAYNTTNRMPKK